jgi:uncharacterized protein YutE (UPF0331/DUF86 family)
MKSDLRKEEIHSKLKEIKNSLYYIKEYLPSDFKYLNNRKDKNALYKEVEFSIQLMIDVCAVINSDVIRETPSDEDSIIDLLKEKKIISSDLAKMLHEMKGFRNILVHRYGEINDEEAYENIKEGLEDFEKFVKEIEKFLKKTG